MRQNNTFLTKIASIFNWQPDSQEYLELTNIQNALNLQHIYFNPQLVEDAYNLFINTYHSLEIVVNNLQSNLPILENNETKWNIIQQYETLVEEIVFPPFTLQVLIPSWLQAYNELLATFLALSQKVHIIYNRRKHIRSLN